MPSDIHKGITEELFFYQEGHAYALYHFIEVIIIIIVVFKTSVELVVAFTEESYTVQEGSNNGTVCVTVIEGQLEKLALAQIMVSSIETSNATGQYT